MQEEGIIDWQDLAPSGYRLFGPMKDGVRGRHYSSDKEVKTAQMKWLKEQLSKFHKAGINILIRVWNIAIQRNGALCLEVGM